KAVRTISPFKPGTEDLSDPYRLPQGEKKLRVKIIGNSFYPKVAEVPVGTTIEWTNEEVFTFFEGEFSGMHDVKTYEGPEDFWSPMLGHAEKWSVTLNKPGEYKYICTPHPYMEGIIRVK
ncbi:MAG: plastocyanin/azurin family copper-binding protein, partial [Limisphaerales bacterium]